MEDINFDEKAMCKKILEREIIIPSIPKIYNKNLISLLISKLIEFLF